MMRTLTEQADGITPPYTVAKMFFAATPAVNRELNESIERHMKRDQSPTYWFRVMRARELLAMYRKDPHGFRKLAGTFRYSIAPQRRAPHRLAVWLAGGGESAFQSCDHLQRDEGRGISALDDPEYFGFRLRSTEEQEHCLLASRSAIGTLTYIAFETRRLHDAMKLSGERFVPLEVTSLVKPAGGPAERVEATRGEVDLHSTGHVFSIHLGELPPGQRQALEFVLGDLGWAGYLGFIRAAKKDETLHIGCSPASRDFFDEVFAEAFQTAEAEPDNGIL
jgi:hypothetical protein